MTLRTNYWSCTKFSDKVNKKIKELFPKNSKKLIIISEDILDKIQDVISFPYDKYKDIETYIYNIKNKSNILYSSKLKLGEYYDLDEKILFCCFQGLVDYVEKEMAALEFDYLDEKHLWKNGRSAKLGVQHLEWEMSLVYDEYCGTPEDYGKPMHQAIVAKEKLELYYWWVNIRPNRIDLYGNFYQYLEKNYNSTMYDILYKIEDNYNKEDNEMLKRLMEIRLTLWS